MPTTKQYVWLPHGQVHVRASGELQDPVLVLLHQVPSASTMWEAVMQPLARRGYRVLALDLPGYGASDPLPVAPELADYAEVVMGTLGALGHDRAFVVGHHTGASVGLLLAADHPEVITAVALWGLANHVGPEAEELADETPPALGSGYIDDVREWWASRLVHATPGGDGAVMARALAELVVCGVHRPDGHNAVGRTDHTALLTRAVAPVLLMTGGREMLDEITRQAAADHPERTELAVLGDNGMDVADDEPELFSSTVDGFFRRVDDTSFPVLLEEDAHVR
ncbi:alpha/beta fold hydrolase [Herbiconiux sp. P15]|uniref:alpha/beta fold hydrolase n=1 Tax=Herbiconiux liukaitaii TaxID=3342799 RepID=UPI0035BB8D3B